MQPKRQFGVRGEQMRFSARLVTATIAFLPLLCWTAACRPESSLPRAPITGFIAVVGAGESDPLWPVLRAAAAHFQRDTPAIEVQAHTPPVASVNLQADLVRRLRSKGMRGVCIQIIDPKATSGLLESLRAEGAVVVTLLHPVESAEPFLHCSIDDADMGAALADTLAGHIPAGGTAGVLYHDGDEAAKRRHQAFRQQMTRHAGISILRELDCGGDPATARTAMREAMKRFPGIDGWVTLGDWPVRPPHDDQPLLPPECALVAPGPIPQWDALIGTGVCRVVVMANYREMVDRALQMCLLATQQEMLQRQSYVAPPVPVDADSLRKYREQWAQWTALEPPPPGSS